MDKEIQGDVLEVYKKNLLKGLELIVISFM